MRRTFFDYEATRRVLLNDPCIILGHNWYFSHYATGRDGLVAIMECQICGTHKLEETWTSGHTAPTQKGDYHE